MRYSILLALLLLVNSISSERSFTIDYQNNVFLKDGQPFRYISSSLHYMRIPRLYWSDRMQKVRKSGVNAIQIYVPWNLHEPTPGNFQFSGQNDISYFLDLAQQQDLLVVLRPGPFICGEWEFGGLPYWLLKSSTVKLRTRELSYMMAVDRYFSVLFTILKPYLYENGGPIISAQVENEYGSFGCDHEYMKEMEGIFRKYLGNNIILFTVDGAADHYLKCGTLDSLFTTIDFAVNSGDPETYLEILRKYQPNGPMVNSELYTGWFDVWGGNHSVLDTKIFVSYLEKVLALNASVNMYSVHGGTNFGFMNGALPPFQPEITSYDYDAPLTESCDPTEKYFALQDLISKYLPIPEGPQPEPVEKLKPMKISASNALSLFDTLNFVRAIDSHTLLTFEELDVAYGYVLYETAISCSIGDAHVLNLTKFHDRAYIMVDEVYYGLLQRDVNNTMIITCERNKPILHILIENQGRYDYGPTLDDSKKGLLSEVLFDDEPLSDWRMYCLGDIFPQPAKSKVAARNITGPAFYFFEFQLEAVHDSFLKMDQWRKGAVVVNDWNLGRYWWIGPQQTLYVPATMLRANDNLLTVFETEMVASDPYVEFVEEPILSDLRAPPTRISHGYDVRV